MTTHVFPAEHHHIGADTREWLIAPNVCPELISLHMELCGLSTAQQGFSFSRAGWARSQILVCHAGVGEVWLDGAWQSCPVGSAYLCPVDARHAYRAVPGHEWEVVWAIFIESPDHEPLIPHGQPRLITTDPRGITDVIRNLHREALGPAHHLVRTRWVELLSVLFARIIDTSEPSNSATSHRLDRLWEAVDQDLANAWTLGDLARLAEVGPEQLRRLCLRLHQRSPIHQLTWLRMQRAATLLTSRRATVSDVAQAVGYDNAFAFSTAFKRVLGKSPSSWRDQSSK